MPLSELVSALSAYKGFIMFTGLIQKTAKIVDRRVSGGAGSLFLKTETAFDALEFGESIAVNGACLTLEKYHADGLMQFHVLVETLKRTNLGAMKIGGVVNLERAMALGDKLGGHMVSGHVDAVGELLDCKKAASDYEFSIKFPPELYPFLVEKGSISVDGISLTLIDVGQDFFTVQLIPVTYEHTALRFRQKGEPLNIETDMLGKYIFKQLSFLNSQKTSSKLDIETLRNAGWN